MNTNETPKLVDYFTAEQLAALREEFGKIETVNTDRLPEFHALFDSMADHVLAQVAGAGIKWLSSLARNACARLGIDFNRENCLQEAREKSREYPQMKAYVYQYGPHRFGFRFAPAPLDDPGLLIACYRAGQSVSPRA